MINNVSLTGRLTKDVETYGTMEKPVAKFTLAVQRNYKNAQGQRDADFIRVVAYGKTAEIVKNHFNKGMLVGITGSIITGSYTKPDGTTIYNTNVVMKDFTFLESKETTNTWTSPSTTQVVDNTPHYYQTGVGNPNVPHINDDDLPLL